MSKAVKNLLINDLRSTLQGVNDCLLVNVIGLNSTFQGTQDDFLGTLRAVADVVPLTE